MGTSRAKRGTASCAGSVEEQRLDGRVPAGALHILLVEDNPGDERLVQLALSEDPLREFQVTSAKTLGASLRLAQSRAFDAILLDMQLPDSNGLANVKELALAAPRTPIVVMTGLADDSLAMQVSAHGAQDYLLKGSIGIAVFPDHARKADGLINSADATMLLAKRCGGNRFRVADPGLMGEGWNTRTGTL